MYIFHGEYFLNESEQFDMFFFKYVLFQIKCCFLYVFSVLFFMLNQCL